MKIYKLICIIKLLQSSFKEIILVIRGTVKNHTFNNNAIIILIITISLFQSEL